MNPTFMILLLMVILFLFFTGLMVRSANAAILLIGCAFLLLFWPCLAIQSKNTFIGIQEKEIVRQTEEETIYIVEECWHFGCLFDEEVVTIRNR